MKAAEQMTELRGLTATDLAAKAKELDDQIFRVRLQLSMGQTESAAKVKPLRRERARVKTVLTEKAKGGKA
jgi:large subunit ribosomal protein L29